MVQHVHFYVYTPKNRKQGLEGICPPMFKQHCSPWLKGGSNPSVC